MSITVEPLAESDIDTYCSIVQAAFINGIGAILLHGGAAATPSTHAALCAAQLARVRDDPSARYMKAVQQHDDGSRGIVAVAKWEIFPHEQTAAELESTLRAPTSADAGYVAANAPIFAHLLGSRREVLGARAYVYLSVLAVAPAQQRRGAGAELVRWGVERADALGVPVYLESSPEARRLYERFGFEVVKQVSFEMDQFGREDLSGTVDVNTVMMRPARERLQ